MSARRVVPLLDGIAALTSRAVTHRRAGKSGRKEQLEHCSQQCRAPYQRAGAATQQEIGGFQQRLNNAMQMCNADAQGMVTPDMANDSRKMKRVEDSLLKCIQGAVEKSRGGLKPMRQRIEAQIKS